MSTFLKSCAYGTLGGAAIGLATLAMSDHPDGKINNIARGASLGLYAGIGVGLYLINNPSQSSSVDDYTLIEQPKMPVVWFQLTTHQNKIDGAQLNISALTF